MPKAKHIYGQQGGNWLDKPTPAEERASFAAAVENGDVVRARCDCPVRLWWMARRDVGRTCELCSAMSWAIDEPKAAA